MGLLAIFIEAKTKNCPTDIFRKEFAEDFDRLSVAFEKVAETVRQYSGIRGG